MDTLIQIDNVLEQKVQLEYIKSTKVLTTFLGLVKSSKQLQE